MKTTMRIFLSIFLPTLVFGQMHTYRYRRDLQKIENTDWYGISIDADILSRMTSTEDIRLYELKSRDTIEIPYVLERLETRANLTESPVALINRAYDKGKNIYQMEFELADNLTIDQLRFDFVEKNFDWKFVELEAGHDHQTWLSIDGVQNDRLFSIQNEFVNYHYTTIHFTPSNYRYYRLSIATTGGSAPTITPLQSDVFVAKSEVQTGSWDSVRYVQYKIHENVRDRTTEILIQFDRAHPMDKIELELSSDRDFYRKAEAYFYEDSTITPSGKIVLWQAWTHGILSSLESPRKLEGPAIRVHGVKVIIRNFNDRPLQIKGLSVFAVPYRLKAELKGDSKYVLVYGKDNDKAPVYDAVYFKDNIPTELSDVILDDEQMFVPFKPYAPVFHDKLWIWMAMGVVILVLTIFSIRLIKKAPKE